jgi:microcystin-dependent protein
MADVLKLQTLDGMLDYPSAEDPSKGTTEQQFQEYLKNHQSVMSDMVAVTLWQPSTAYVVGQVIYSPNMPANSCARVATAGTTGSAEPAWGAVGSTTSDGTAAYTMMYRTVDFATNDVAKAGTDAKTIVTPAALAAVLAAFKTQVISDVHPIGEVWETTTDDDPNKLWPGTTWVKMDPGRVLVSSGDYTENGTKYSYALGATGGEAKHTITVDEMASHGHSASSSWASLIGDTYTALPAEYDNVKASGIVSCSKYGDSHAAGDSGKQGNGHLHIDASHSHTIAIANTGGGAAHENRQPFTAVNRWRRTA